jgi:hypothetical protein
MFEFLFELIFEIFGEALLQATFAALTEAGLHFGRRPDAQPRQTSTVLLVLGYALLGAIAGGLSLLVFSSPFMHNHAARLANLLLSPIAGGLAMALLGAWRRRRGQQTIQLDRFAYGFLFTLAMALVRFFGTY